MNHEWQQPFRPMEVLIPNTNIWASVVFIRSRNTRGWEVITMSGNTWSDLDTELRHAQADS